MENGDHGPDVLEDDSRNELYEALPKSTRSTVPNPSLEEDDGVVVPPPASTSDANGGSAIGDDTDDQAPPPPRKPAGGKRRRISTTPTSEYEDDETSTPLRQSRRAVTGERASKRVKADPQEPPRAKRSSLKRVKSFGDAMGSQENGTANGTTPETKSKGGKKKQGVAKFWYYVEEDEEDGPKDLPDPEALIKKARRRSEKVQTTGQGSPSAGDHDDSILNGEGPRSRTSKTKGTGRGGSRGRDRRSTGGLGDRPAYEDPPTNGDASTSAPLSQEGPPVA